MKILYTSAAITLALFATAFTCADSSNQKIMANNTVANGFAVVELFTSEGCSSCPSADDAVAKLLKDYNSNVYVLGYHVDYWNNLGWKDQFSNAAYSQRQRNYARALKLSSVYTPQVVINGEEQFVGSDQNKLHAVINKDLKEMPGENLSVTAKIKGNSVDVSYQTNASDNNLNIALIQSVAISKVQRGENSGATLHHVNIVRNIQTIPLKNSSGNITFGLPAGLSAKDCGIIAFVQNGNNLKITSAAKAEIQQ